MNIPVGPLMLLTRTITHLSLSSSSSAVRRAGKLRVYGLAGSALIDAARAAGVSFASEGFCDRAYDGDGLLRSRSRPGAVIEDPVAAARQAVDIVVRGRVRAESGDDVGVQADTLCIHGDTPGAVEIARLVRTALEGAGVRVAALE